VINGGVAVVSMVIGSEYKMMWLGLKLYRKLTPSQDGQVLLFACSLLHTIGHPI
jgi:hypothetical protein